MAGVELETRKSEWEVSTAEHIIQVSKRRHTEFL